MAKTEDTKVVEEKAETIEVLFTQDPPVEITGKLLEKWRTTPCKMFPEEPRMILTRRATGKRYLWTYSSKGENLRQKQNRERKKVRNTDVEAIGLNAASTASLKKAGHETVGQLMKADIEDYTIIKEIGDGSAKKIRSFMETVVSG